MYLTCTECEAECHFALSFWNQHIPCNKGIHKKFFIFAIGVKVPYSIGIVYNSFFVETISKTTLRNGSIAILKLLSHSVCEDDLEELDLDKIYRIAKENF